MIDSTHIARVTLEEIRTRSSAFTFDDALDATPTAKLERLLRDAPVPPEDALATILEEAFWASLQSNERRPSRFRLELGDDRENPAQLLHELEADCGLERKRLGKLAQAVDAERGSIVWRQTDQGARIVGFRGPRPERSNPTALVVRCGEPGAIDIAWYGSWLVSYRRGELRRASQCHLPGSKALNEEHVALFGDFWPSLLQKAIRRIQRRRHGGSIWILPDSCDVSGLNIGFALKRQPPMASRLTDHEAWLDSLADFAGADGAVVVDSKLSAIGFGAFVELLDACPVHRLLVDGAVERTSLESVGGGRHRSAVSFCAKFAPAMAYVVSEDGPVTMVSCAGSSEPIVAEIAPFDHLYASYR